MKMWLAWMIALSILTLLFAWLWRIADKLDKREKLERDWEDFIQYLWRVDPDQAAYWEWLRNQ